LMGTGPKESELKALASQLRADNVLFLERRQYWEMPKINSLADVLLVHLKDLPFFSATIPGKTQVSMACGRPILMAVRGDSADLVEKAQAGLTCEPMNERALADAILRLYRMDRDQLDSMGARGRQFYLNEMSLETGGRRMDALFRQIVKKDAHGSAAR
jgi:putative colanic acid biosynthesis glycosyltransferase WcaI